MNVTARRIYYLSAFVVFLIVGPLLVLWTNGWRWTGFGTGFVRTGALYISSDPRATVTLNGVMMGATPKRLSHLAPGVYTVGLMKPGIAPWSQTIRITADTAKVIGPVQLFPPAFSNDSISAAPTEAFITDRASRVTVGIRQGDEGWLATDRWPAVSNNTVSLPLKPLSLDISPDFRVRIYHGDVSSVVLTTNDPSSAWTIAMTSPVFWDPSSHTIFYSLVANQIIRYDALTKTSTPIGIATSCTLLGGTMWLTQVANGTTTLAKQQTFGQTVPDTVEQLVGVWTLLESPDGVIVLKNTATKETNEIRFDALTGQTSIIPFGPVDQLWWTDRNQPPLWISGNDLYSRDAHNLPQLLDRLPQTPQYIHWTLASHLILLFDGQSLSLRSVSSQQGRSTILSANFQSPSSLVGFDLNNKTAVVSDSSPSRLQVIRW